MASRVSRGGGETSHQAAVIMSGSTSLVYSVFKLKIRTANLLTFKKDVLQ